MDYAKLLAKLSEANREEETTSAEDALKLIRLAEQISKIDLGKVEEEKRNALSPMDRLVEDLKANKDVARKLAGKKKREHWKRAKRKKREYDKNRYREHLKPQRKKELAEKLTTARGWWEYLNRNWRWLKTPVELTEEEWNEVLYPAIYPRVPVFFRYDAKQPIRLDNLVVKDTETREVLFDGKEWLLRKQGYVL